MNRIKQLREENKITQEELAKRLNLTSKGIVSMYEKGDRKPSLEILVKLSEIFNCSIDYLLGKSDIKNIAEEFNFAYHKETEGLSDEDIKEALRIYKEIKKNIAKNEDKKDESK